MDRDSFKGLNEGLASLAERRLGEITSLSVVVANRGGIVYEGCWGRRFVDPDGAGGNLPVTGDLQVTGDREVTLDTKFRIASMSKPVVTIGLMRLVERGLLDLEADLSDYLGFSLRNPSFPGEAISASMLLSHTSSLRDIEDYNLPLPMHIKEFLLPGGERYAEGGHFALPLPGQDTRPGRFYSYCNLGYGILATAIERITHRRFDRYLREEVLAPLGLDAGFNVLDLSDSGFADLAPIWQRTAGQTAPGARAPGAGESAPPWQAREPWLATVDDFRGVRPELPCRALPGLGSDALDRYELGTNGSLFSPQGGLRISARDLSRPMRLLMRGGELDGLRLLEPASVAAMMRPRWTWDPRSRNGDTEYGATRETGLGLAHTTATRDAAGGDRFLAEGGPRLWGHHGSAYGLLGGMFFDPEAGLGFVYIIGGTTDDEVVRRGRYSSATVWEEEVCTAILGQCYEDCGQKP